MGRSTCPACSPPSSLNDDELQKWLVTTSSVDTKSTLSAAVSQCSPSPRPSLRKQKSVRPLLSRAPWRGPPSRGTPRSSTTDSFCRTAARRACPSRGPHRRLPAQVAMARPLRLARFVRRHVQACPCARAQRSERIPVMPRQKVTVRMFDAPSPAARRLPRLYRLGRTVDILVLALRLVLESQKCSLAAAHRRRDRRRKVAAAG